MSHSTTVAVEVRVCKSCDTQKLIKSFPISHGYRTWTCFSCRYDKKKKTGKCRYCYAPRELNSSVCKKHKEAKRKRRHDDKASILYHYSNGTMKCQCLLCDEKQPKFLTIDHVDGGGNEHRRKLSTTKNNRQNPSSGNFHSWLSKNNYPNGYTVLCFNCNCGKGIYGVCPHILDLPLDVADAVLTAQNIGRMIFNDKVKDGKIVLKDGATECNIVRQSI